MSFLHNPPKKSIFSFRMSPKKYKPFFLVLFLNSIFILSVIYLSFIYFLVFLSFLLPFCAYFFPPSLSLYSSPSHLSSVFLFLLIFFFSLLSFLLALIYFSFLFLFNYLLLKFTQLDIFNESGQSFLYTQKKKKKWYGYTLHFLSTPRGYLMSTLGEQEAENHQKPSSLQILSVFFFCYHPL